MPDLRKLAVGMVALFACMAWAPAVASAGTIDQQWVDFDGGNSVGISSTGSKAQTFTAGRTGTLDDLQLGIGVSGSPNAPLIVEIRDTVAGEPGSIVLASASVPAASIPNIVVPFMHVPLTAPSVAGVQYAIVLRSTANAGGFYEWHYGGSNFYAGGHSWTVSNATGTGPWGDIVVDLDFITYVLSPPASTPSPKATGQQAAALAKCKKKKSKRKRKKCKKKALKLPV